MDLPLRPQIGIIKSYAKRRLKERRANGELDIKLHQVQLELAKEYGFASWPKLVKGVEAKRAESRRGAGKLQGPG